MPGLPRLCTPDRENNTYPRGRIGIPFTEKGFTLLEILAAMTVCTLLLGVTYSLYLFGVKSFQDALTRLDLQQNGSYANIASPEMHPDNSPL